MKRFYIAITALVAMTIGVSCSGGVGHDTGVPADSVTLTTTTVNDTSSFALSDGGKCSVSAEAKVTYPQSFKDKSATEQLQEIFAAIVLEREDSATIDKALAEYARVILAEYGGNEEPAHDLTIEDETEITRRYNTKVNIESVYNKNGLLVICKEETVAKNGKETARLHSYYNIDLQQMRIINLSDILRDDAMRDVSAVLKQQLIEQNNVQDEEELGELGYYNLDNLNVTNNFKINDKGVTWSYRPNELAIDRVGEPVITLPFDRLKPFYSDDSVLKRVD